MWNRELLPYRYLIKRDIPAVMSGHLAFPNVTGEIIPASLSGYFLNNILRERMGFEGIIITDDMRMAGAIAKAKDTPSACIQAIEAGNDLIMISHGTDIYERVWDRMYSKMENDPLFRSKVKKAVERILEIKLRYLRSENRVPLYPDRKEIEENIPSGEAEEYFLTRHADLLQ